MYHLTRLVMPNATATEVYKVLSEILIVVNFRVAKLVHRTLDERYEEGGSFDFDMDFDEDIHECFEPSQMKLPKGAKAYTYYTAEK